MIKFNIIWFHTFILLINKKKVTFKFNKTWLQIFSQKNGYN